MCATADHRARGESGNAHAMSFRATYFGWQGWLFETDRAAVAIDPLLVDQIGADRATRRPDRERRELRRRGARRGRAPRDPLR
jgi:hypothetical protein